MREPGFDESIFFELTPDLMCIAGRDGFFRKVNPAVIKKLEYSEEELMARPISSFIYSEDKPATQHRRSELLRGKSLLNFQNRYVTKSGKLVWLEWTSVFYPDRDVVFAIAKDIKRSGGLVRMRERASSINGELTVLSERGKGTAVRVRIKKEGTTKSMT